MIFYTFAPAPLALKRIRTLVSLCVFWTCGHAIAQTPEKWVEWGSVVHGGYGSLIAYGIRLGEDALQRLKAQRREVSVEYTDSPAAPCACVLDGVAIAVTASVGQRSVQLVSPLTSHDLLGRVKLTHKKTRQSVVYELPISALALMNDINTRLPPRERHQAVMALDADKLFNVLEP